VDRHRKPTSTDTTINFLSNHPIKQKMAAYRFYITRMHSLPLNPDKKQKEWETIQSTAKKKIFHNAYSKNLTNGYRTRVITLTTRRTQNNLDHVHISQPQNKKNHKFIQKHQHRDSVQGHNNVATTHNTHQPNPNIRIRKKVVCTKSHATRVKKHL
jgi:hypothetical protein